jgi:hypothetical protein
VLSVEARLSLLQRRVRSVSQVTAGWASSTGLTCLCRRSLGRRDVMIDAEQTARRLAANVPSATVRLLPDAGHLLPDQTATVLDLLVSLDGRAVTA